MHASGRSLHFFLALALALASSPVRAQSEADKILAATLFKEGKALLENNRIPEACGKLRESFRLEAAGGTLLNLAVCHELEGRTATAWTEFVQALGLAHRDNREDRVEFAKEYIAALEARLSRLTVEVPLEARIAGLLLRQGGVELRPPAWGTAIPLDPGEYTIEATARGRKPWSRKVTIPPGPSRSTITVPLLEPLDPVPLASSAQAPPEPPSATSLPTPTSASAQPFAAPPTPASSGYRQGGLLALGLGAVGVGAGLYLGLRALDKHQQSNDLCPTSKACTGNGAALEAEAGKAADLSTLSFLLGGAGVATGVVLLLLDPAPATGGLSPVLGQSRAGLIFTRAF